MEVAAFYHLWADGFWEEPFAEFLRALDYAEFDGSLYLGIIGSLDGRRRVEAAIGRPVTEIYSTNKGNEPFTINAIRSYAQNHDGAVIYAHTKGATTGYNQLQGPWRWLMTDAVVSRWLENVTELDNYDAIGWVWLDEREGWDPGGFAGNFWMARCDYLRRLEPCATEDRGAAEVWIGQLKPRVLERCQWDRKIGPPLLSQWWPYLLDRWQTLRS